MKNVFVLFLVFLTTLVNAQRSMYPKIARIFQKRCNTCHLVPDLKYKSDQAWFGQVMFTA